jgi:arsenate reductase
MAAALFNLRADPARAVAISAGTTPAKRIHAVVARAMQEVGIDLAGVVPRRLTPELVKTVDVFISLGCGEVLPVRAGLEIDGWSIDDPEGEPIEIVRSIRDVIDTRVRRLVSARRWLRDLAQPASHVA